MSIEYVEIIGATSLETIGIIDSAKSIIWRSAYFGVGDFEIYAPATAKHMQLLAEGNFVAKPYNDNVGIIESFNIISNVQDGRMIVASGRLAKSILDRRHIYKLSGKTNTPTILSGNVETAIRTVITNNAINCSFDSKRNIPVLQLGASAGLPEIIVDYQGQPAQKQVSFQNLLEYTDEVLQEYKLSSKITLDRDAKKLKYSCYKGTDRSADNTSGNDPVIFSAEYDNLSESNYLKDVATAKNTALIGGEGEGLARFYSLLAGTETGLSRRETFVDASSISKSYEEGQTYTDAEYKKLLDAQGKLTLATMITTETFDGKLNVTGGIWRINEHYFLGDIVTIQNNQLGIYANVRIAEVIETQDESGYSIEITYESERND